MNEMNKVQKDAASKKAAKKEDLRVIKTRASIMRVFEELIKKKPVEKITVTEIAKNAQINKGTFYLHYSDIYDLYDQYLRESTEEHVAQIEYIDTFFTDPEYFVRRFVDGLNEVRTGHMRLAPPDTPSNRKIPGMVTKAMRRRLYATGRLAPSVENDIRIDMILLSMVSLSFDYGIDHREELVQIVSESIRQCFP